MPAGDSCRLKERSVWIVREGDCHIIGRRNAVCAEMSKFLASAVLQEEDLR